jgi:hypothetical protein
MKKLLALVSSALVAVLVMTSPLAIAQEVGVARGNGSPPASAVVSPPTVDSAGQPAARVATSVPGNTFYWGHCQEAWYYTGESGCWCYFINSSNVQIGWLRLEGSSFQYGCEYFKLAASSYHWLGIYWNTTDHISYLRLYSY